MAHSLITGCTLTAPMQSWQQFIKSPIRSRESSFQFRSATSSNQPSGIRPSKKGNMVLLEYAALCSGNVRLTGL
ncbi:MAG TPA: hypothetical protein VN371_09610, partial [Chlorobaculum sp.]|nr:hypothetical protein [Chlorobaculum sp.]